MFEFLREDGLAFIVIIINEKHSVAARIDDDLARNERHSRHACDQPYSSKIMLSPVL